MNSKKAQGLEALLQCICAVLAFSATEDNTSHYVQPRG